VIEAITENLGMKLELWRELDEFVKDGAVFATTTSSLSVIDQRVHRTAASLHRACTLQPRQVMPLLEVVPDGYDRRRRSQDRAFEFRREVAS